MPPSKEKPQPTMDEFLAGMDREYGKGSLFRLGDSEFEMPEIFPTGSIALDEALGTGGLPRGRIIEIYGPESSGKTSMALHAMGNAQRQGLRCGFIDAEYAFSPEYAAGLGVDVDDLYLCQPDYGEQGLQIVERMVKSGHFGAITIDSVAALVPKAEIEGEIGDSHVGLQARMMSQSLRILTGLAADKGTALIFINQLREKVGVFFGPSETTAGGKALKFYASVRLDVRRIETLKQGDQKVGSRVKVTVVKNKLSPPFKVAEFDFIFGSGVSHEGELLDYGVTRKVLKKSGAWYVYGSENIGNGRPAASRYLAEHPDVAAAIEAAIREAPVPVALTAKAAAGAGRSGLISGDDNDPWDDEASA